MSPPPWRSARPRPARAAAGRVRRGGYRCCTSARDREQRRCSARLRASPSALEQRGILHRRVLAAHRIGDRLFEAAHAFPLRGGPGPAVAAAPRDPPVGFPTVIVWGAGLGPELAAGA